MPWKVRKRKCRQGDGDKGKYVVVKVKRGGGTKQSSCHTTKNLAKRATRARYASAYGESVMKIAAGKLKQIIQEELSSLAEQGLSASDMAKAEIKAENTAIVKDIIMLGLEAYTSGKMEREDELEYGDDVAGVLDDNPAVTKSIADIFREIEQEAGRQGAGSGAPPGSPLEDFDEEMEEALEDFPVSAAEGQLSARDVARDIIMVKVGPEQYTKRGRPSWVERAVEEHGEDFIMTRAVGTAKDFGYE